MKILNRLMQQVVWIVVVLLVVVIAIIAFQSMSSGMQSIATPIDQATHAEVTALPSGNPGPDSTRETLPQPDPTGVPSGYPVSSSTPEPTPIYDIESLEATESARLTAEAQIPTATPFILIGPRTIVDETGQYSLELPEGWWGASIVGTRLRNYDDNTLTDLHQLPDWAIQVEISIADLGDHTITEVLEGKKISDVESSNALTPGSGELLTFTEIQPLQLGPYSAFEYYMTISNRGMARYIAFAHSEQLVFVGIMPVKPPANDKAMSEALSILATLLFISQ